AHLEGVSEQLVPGVDAHAILQLAANLRGDLQDETMLAAIGHYAFPFEAITTRFLELFVLSLTRQQQFDDYVFRFQAVERNANLEAQTVAVHEIAPVCIQALQLQLVPALA